MPDRFVLKNGNVYDYGVGISPDELDASILRNYDKLRANSEQVQGADGDLRTLMQRFATLAENKMGPELQQALDIRARLGRQKAIADALRTVKR